MTKNISNNFNIDAHYSNDMKVKRSKRVVINAPTKLQNRHILTDKELSNRVNETNNDIYVKLKKEKERNGFNKNLFIKILCGVILFTAIATNFNKIRNFFKKS